MSGAAKVGWCPGALRPMASGDGLILRVKPRGGRLTLDQAQAIAALSARFGNGHLDLTGRANLQIRGAREDTRDALTAGLRAAGLLDADPDAEALRNIVASPLAGVDPDCVAIGPFAVALENCLAGGGQNGFHPEAQSAAFQAQASSLRGGAAAEAFQNPGAGLLERFASRAMTEAGRLSLRVLPAKWSFVVDGGGRLPLGNVTADMRFRFDGSGALRIGLASAWSEPVAEDFDLATLLARTAALMGSWPEPLHMKGLIEEIGPGSVFASLGLRPAVQPVGGPAPATAAALFATGFGTVAFAPPFGDLPADTLAAVVDACRAAGAADLRLTPWRILLATGLAAGAALSARLAQLGLVTQATDPRLAVSACVGAPACHRATTPTRADAAMLAGRIAPDGRSLHVSGCAKNCARPADAGWTLVARNGRYDLLRGRDAVPCVTGLSSTEAANWLSRAERPRIS